MQNALKTHHKPFLENIRTKEEYPAVNPGNDITVCVLCLFPEHTTNLHGMKTAAPHKTVEQSHCSAK